MLRLKGDNGTYLTRDLFYEWNNPDAPYSLRDTGKEACYVARSGKKYLSLPYIFRNEESEYDCALEVVGSWQHWKKLKGLDWFMTGKVNGSEYTGLNDWKAEKELAQQSKASAVLMKAIEEGDVGAAKFVYDKKTKGTKVGRPETKKPRQNLSSVVSLAKNIKVS